MKPKDPKIKEYLIKKIEDENGSAYMYAIYKPNLTIIIARNENIKKHFIVKFEKIPFTSKFTHKKKTDSSIFEFIKQKN